MKDSYTIQQDVSLSDYYRICLHTYLYLKLTRRLFLFIAALSLLSSLLRVAGTDKSFSVVMFVYDLLPVLVLAAFFLVFSGLLCVYIYKTRPWLFKNVSYEYTHWGITGNGEKTEFSKPWREITGMKETKSYFIFYVGQRDLHFLQKKMFADAAELTDFRNFVNEKMNR